MHTAVYLLTPYLGCILFFCLMQQLLPGRVRWWLMPLLLTPMLLSHVPKLLWGSTSAAAQTASLLGGLAMYIGYPLLLFGGRRWKRLAVSLFLAVVQILSDMLCFTLCSPRFGTSAEQYSLQQLVLYTAISLTLFALLGSCCVLAFRWISMQRFRRFYLLFLAFPVSQHILLFYCLYSDFYAPWLFLGVMLGLGADLALLAYTVAREKREQLEAELRQLQRAMELEQLRYQALDTQREQLAHVRHDLNNALAAIRYLIQSGERSEARRLLRQLQDSLDRAGQEAEHG